MEFKRNYLSISVVTFFVAIVGSLFTSMGMDWYDTLNLPSIAPSGSLIGIVWTVIFILSTASAIIFWNSERGDDFKIIFSLFIFNAFLNISWSFLFFVQKSVCWSVIEMTLLNSTTLLLIIYLWNYKRISAYLLLPYFLWVSFATYLACLVYSLN